MEEINYSELEQETIDFISKNKVMVLATCSAERVTARMVQVVSDCLTVYFLTGESLAKYKQIKDNPNVALCIGNMQYEGVAKITCRPLDNPYFAENHKRLHESAFNMYAHLKDSVIIEVTPKLITFWKTSAENKPYRDFLDIKKREAYRDYYNIE